MSMKPTIHLNGSGFANLIAPISDAMRAVRKATELLCEAAPNQRDYYTQPNTDAWIAATEWHANALAALNGVRRGLESSYEHLTDQERTRKEQRR